MNSFIINTLTLIVMLFATFGIATEVLNFKFDKMARPIEQELYRSLMESQFNFIEGGVIDIGEIYDEVHLKFRNLCDDNYQCPHGNNTPEWKHRVQSALGYLKETTDKIDKFGIKNFWEFK